MSRSQPVAHERCELDDEAEAIVCELAELPLAYVQALGAALERSSDAQFASLGGVLVQFDPDMDNPLVAILLRRWLRCAVQDGHADQLLRHLSNASERPWPVIEKAIQSACAPNKREALRRTLSKRMRMVVVTLVIGVLLSAAACGGDGSAGGSGKVETISSVEQFAHAFDDDAGDARLVLLLSPT
jgi:hypothetical protein